MSSTAVIHTFQDRVRRATAKHVQIQEKAQQSSLPRLIQIVELLRLQQVAENTESNATLHTSILVDLPATQRSEIAFPKTDRVLFANNYDSPFDFDGPQRRLMRKYCNIWDDFFSGEIYLSWREGRAWELCCYGVQGCGKSTLAAAIVADLKQFYDKNAIIVSLFLDVCSKQGFKIYQTPKLDPISALRYNILRQIKVFKSASPQHTPPLDAEQDVVVKGRTLLDQLDLEFKSLSLEDPSFQAFFIVDGLDRCPREIATAYLKEIARLGGRVLTTREHVVSRSSQKYCDVDGCDSKWVWIHYHCQGCGPDIDFDICWTCYKEGYTCENHGAQFTENYKYISQPLTNLNHSGISKYIQWEIERELSSSSVLREMMESEGFMERFTDAIAAKAGGALIIARIYMNYLIQKQRPNDLLETLTHVFEPEAAYFASLMSRINQQHARDRTLALVSIQIISSACSESMRGHITYPELVAALQLRLPSNANIESAEELCRICQSMVGVAGDDEIVKPFHQDLEIYLYEECTKCFLGVEVDMASLCLASIRLAIPYVNLSPTEENGVKECFERDPFLAYAVQSLGCHLSKTPSTEAWQTAVELLTDERDLNSYLLLACLSPKQTAPAFILWPGSSPLHFLAFYGLTEGLKYLQDSIAGILNALDPVYGRTPLFVAIERRQDDFLAELLELGADTRILNGSKASALYEATGCIDSNAFDLLMQKDAWRGFENTLGQLMVRAADLQQPQRLHQLVTLANAHVEKLDDEWHTVLIRCVHATNEECISCLVQCLDLQWDRPNDSGENILHVAAKSSLGALKKMLTATPESVRLSMLDSRVLSSGKTTLMLAVENLGGDSVEAVRFLSQAGADLEIPDDNGRRLSHYASRIDNKGTLLDFLYEQEVNFEHVDGNGWTPLHVACCCGSAVAAHKLLDYGVRKDIEDCAGNTPAMVAKYYGELENLNADELLTYDLPKLRDTTPEQPLWSLVLTQVDGIDPGVLQKPDAAIRATDVYNGNTALHYAAVWDKFETTSLLLEDGRIDINARNADGHTALSLYCRRDSDPDPEMVDLLLTHGADCDLVIDSEKDPLQAVAERKLWDAALTIMGHRKTPPPPELDLRILLNEAVKHGRRDSIEKLLELGANVLHHDEDGRLPVQAAEDFQPGSDIVSLLQEYQFSTLSRLCTAVH